MRGFLAKKVKKSAHTILPHIVSSVRKNVIYCKQLNDPASMKMKNRNTLMSTEHFSIHQGVFIFIRFDVNNRRSFCFGSFLFQIIDDLPNHGRHFLLCCKNSFLPYFPDSHGKFLPALVSFDVQYKNFCRHCF